MTRRMLEEIKGMSDVERHELNRSLSREERGFLFGIAFGGAVDAIREGVAQYLYDGLLALTIEGAGQDCRHTLRRLCLLNHSATKLNINLSEIYQGMRGQSTPDFDSLMENWLREGTKDIEMMAYTGEWNGDAAS